MAIESASSNSNKPNITNKHASNSIYIILQSNIDKVTNGIWKRKPFNREFSLPESAIAKVFFDDIFKMYDCGFQYMLDDLIASLGVKRVSKEDSYLTLGRDKDVIKSLTLQLNVN